MYIYIYNYIFVFLYIFSIKSSCLRKFKIFSDNSSLTILVAFQSLHEKYICRIMCHSRVKAS